MYECHRTVATYLLNIDIQTLNFVPNICRHKTIVPENPFGIQYFVILIKIVNKFKNRFSKSDVIEGKDGNLEYENLERRKV